MRNMLPHRKSNNNVNAAAKLCTSRHANKETAKNCTPSAAFLTYPRAVCKLHLSFTLFVVHHWHKKQGLHRLPQAPKSYQHSLCITRQKGQKWHLSTKLSTIVNKLSILINKVINTPPIQPSHLSVGESTLTHLCPNTQQGMSTPPAPVQLPHSSPKIRAPVGYLTAPWG